ncbi:MAG: DEAD/DEAH box helicase [Pirellulales bacterium]|nr:DEAD/DEAH box helicase [Pirellulales bacterium]
MKPDVFHPLVADWFTERFGQPTEPQRHGWPSIAAGRNTLIAAPTGSGKTLAAFLFCIDRLVRQGLEGRLPDTTQVLYVSPLKALSNDIRRNLEVPLQEIGARAAATGWALPELRAAVRTGDTPASQRQQLVRKPPHILVTTPESFYLMLTAAKSRETLRGVSTVIVDEIHALARDKRGSHLALSLERLSALCERPPVRIGISATQKPLDEIANFLVGCDLAGQPRGCEVIDVGHLRDLDLGLEVPPSELSAVCSNEQWREVYEGLCNLIRAHRSTLVFVNTRRMAERVTHMLGQLLGPEHIASHHGSLSREIRLSAEQRLKSGELRAIVATASLELGIDIGYIDLVCQIGSPRSIATWLQRVGRAGHSLRAVPKGRLFPLTRDDLLEGLALIRAVRRGTLDRIEIPRQPLDILAQQIVAAVAADEWREDELYDVCRQAWPYRNLSRSEFGEMVGLLSEGIGARRRSGAHLHRDQMNGRLRARRGARLAAITSGGAIPDTADFRVLTADERVFIGTVNEDFAIESLAGDVFLLGNTSWRIRAVRGGEVLVDDAEGAPATIPFWLGEAPGRTFELSGEVSDLRRELAEVLRHVVTEDGQPQPALDEHIAAAAAWLQRECNAGDWAARQTATYAAAQMAAVGVLPTQAEVVFERFFDESGGMQMVIHAPFGGRINRAWGLAMRKRFCRSFNFELQASADDNGIVLSLGPQHSFPLSAMFGMLNTTNAEPLLKQALLAAPMFQVRWRWNVSRALVLLRNQGGKKVPPQLQRMRADDLLSGVFPQSTACLEHIVGDIEIPDHPLVYQTVYDCLHEAMDLPRWLDLLGAVERSAIRFTARDTREPSPFAYEILNANPYSFLDDAPLEERRARAVATRRSLLPEDVRDLARLDPEAIAQVSQEAWPLVRSADELHDVLLSADILPEEQGTPWRPWLDELRAERRATRLQLPAGKNMWCAAERLTSARAVYTDAALDPPLELPEALRQPVESTAAHLGLVRGYLSIHGPTTAAQIADELALRPTAVEAALESLEGEGIAMRGQMTPRAARRATANGVNASADPPVEWCERRLLARIHRLTLAGARSRVRPVAPEVYIEFLARWQHVAPGHQLFGRRAVNDVVARLAGCELPAGAWEEEVLAARIEPYDSNWLDEVSLFGEVVWGRLSPPPPGAGVARTTLALNRAVPLSLAPREDLPWLVALDRDRVRRPLSGYAQQVLEVLSAGGAMFFHDLLRATSMLPAHLEMALSELAATGWATADGFATIRPLVAPDRHREADARRRRARRRRVSAAGAWRGGRWSLYPGPLAQVSPGDRIERWARLLLKRYGVVFRDVLAREDLAPAWRDLAMVYRRLEARGEVHGGRFVGQVAGEQYAESAAVELLRKTRDEMAAGGWWVICAADPVNLFGIVTDGGRIASKRTTLLAVRQGALVATRQGGQVEFHAELPTETAAEIARALRLGGLVRARERKRTSGALASIAAAAQTA